MKQLRSLLLVVLSLGALTAAVAWQAPQDRLPVLKSGPCWWKGNLHTHSFWSDGDDFPEMIADWYKQHGYDFLTLSDHNVLSEGQRWIDVIGPKSSRAVALKKYLARFGPTWVEQRTTGGKQQVRLKPLSEFRSLLEEPGRFLLIQGEEITSKYAKYPVHLNAINLRDVIGPLSGDSVAAAVRANLRSVQEQQKKTGRPMVAFLNHPNFGWGVKAEDMLAEELRFFEVFNGHPGVKNYGDAIHPGTEKIWDIILALRLGKAGLPIVFGLGTDDAHGYHAYGVGKVNPGRGWIMVRASHLTAEALMTAMHSGDFYASTGVTLDQVRRQDDQILLKIRPEKGVSYKTQFVATLKGTPLESATRKDEKGQPVDVTRIYNPEVGKVMAESDSLEPAYRFAGNELYVRARITSTKAHPNPYQKGDVEMAWTQPLTP